MVSTHEFSQLEVKFTVSYKPSTYNYGLAMVPERSDIDSLMQDKLETETCTTERALSWILSALE